MATPHIKLLARLQREAPELAGVDWVHVCALVTTYLCKQFSVDAHQIFSRCGKTATDFAQETVERYVLGEITWKRSQSPTTFSMANFLACVAKRDVLDQTCRRKKGKRIARHEKSLDEPGNEPLFATMRSAEQELIERDGNGFLRQLYHDLESAPDPDPRFLEYVALQLEELKPAEIATVMELPIGVIHNMRKRLKRRLEPLVPPEILAGRSRGRDKSQRKQKVQHV